MKRLGAYSLLRLGALFALLALSLMMWSFFDKRPIVLVAAMSVGQAIGTLSLALFVVVVLLDLRRKSVLGTPGDTRDGRSSERSDAP